MATDAKNAADVEGAVAVERFEQRTEIPLAVLAVVFFAAYAWPILQPDLSTRWKDACRITNYVIWLIFAVEFLIRIALAHRRRRYMFRHFADVLMLAVYVGGSAVLILFSAALAMLDAERANPGPTFTPSATPYGGPPPP